FCFIIGCGGGAGANTNGSGGTGTGSSGTGTSGPSPTTTTLSTSSTKFALGSSATLTGKVASSTAMTGLLSFNDASFPFVIGSSSNLASGMAQVQMTGQGSIFPGTHVITAQYQGDSINEPSQSGPLNIVVTGPTTLEVAGQTSTDTHIANIPVTIQ
ncbi:MAG TPA: Ig-like domain-containing protein, partial [Candidatus Acidoferrales bacterium]